MKQITLAILLLLCTVHQSNAQDKKISLGLSINPNYSFGIISNNFIGIEEQPKASISVNMFVEYQLTPKSSVGLGLGYQNNGEKTSKIDLTFFGPQNEDLPTKARFIYNHHNIEIPLYYKLNLGEHFYILAGTSGILNLSNTVSSVHFYADGNKERKTQKDKSMDFRTLNISANFGFGWNYLNKEKFSLFIHPYFQYGILGISTNATFNRNILSLGFVTGIRI